MNIIGTYAYFKLEVLYLYQIYRDFLTYLSFSYAGTPTILVSP